MEKLLINCELSKELSNRGSFIPKRCYDNVFNNVGAIGSVFKEENVQVMFGYVSLLKEQGVYTRHACLYLDGEVIDPTIANVYKDKLDKCSVDYIPFKIMGFDEYFSLLSKEGNTSLANTFRVLEKRKKKELVNHGIIIVGD